MKDKCSLFSFSYPQPVKTLEDPAWGGARRRHPVREIGSLECSPRELASLPFGEAARQRQRICSRSGSYSQGRVRVWRHVREALLDISSKHARHCPHRAGQLPGRWRSQCSYAIYLKGSWKTLRSRLCVFLPSRLTLSKLRGQWRK